MGKRPRFSRSSDGKSSDHIHDRPIHRSQAEGHLTKDIARVILKHVIKTTTGGGDDRKMRGGGRKTGIAQRVLKRLEEKERQRDGPSAYRDSHRDSRHGDKYRHDHRQDRQRRQSSYIETRRPSRRNHDDSIERGRQHHRQCSADVRRSWYPERHRHRHHNSPCKDISPTASLDKRPRANTTGEGRAQTMVSQQPRPRLNRESRHSLPNPPRPSQRGRAQSVRGLVNVSALKTELEGLSDTLMVLNARSPDHRNCDFYGRFVAQSGKLQADVGDVLAHIRRVEGPDATWLR